MRPALSYDALRQVVVEQQEEMAYLKEQPWVKRTLLDKGRPLLDTNWIKVITGVRRGGKSIFSHQLLKEREYGYINFDDERFIGLTAKDFNKVLQFILECSPHVKTLLFDEVQNIEEWELFVNRLQRQGYNLVITGSNSKLLSKELTTHLTGRYASIELFPFSFQEFLAAKGFEWSPSSLYKTTERALLYTYLTDYLLHGGFPELVMRGYQASYLRELYDKIISRDITCRYRVRFSQILREIAIYCHANLGERISFQKVKNAFGLNSVHTVKNHFQYLDDGYLVFLLDAFTSESKEKTKQPRKIYTVDNGLSRAINPHFAEHKQKALENLIFQELMRRGEKFSYHKSATKTPCFVLHTHTEVDSLLSVAWSLHELFADKQAKKALQKACDSLGCQQMTILTWEEEETRELPGLTLKMIPAWKWLLNLY